jgi:hypothetical protein
MSMRKLVFVGGVLTEKHRLYLKMGLLASEGLLARNLKGSGSTSQEFGGPRISVGLLARNLKGSTSQDLKGVRVY